MNLVTLKKEIESFASTIGVDLIGFTTAEPFTELKERLYLHREKGYESGFEEKDIEKRCQPELTLDDASSIIAIALAYPSRLKDPPKSEAGAYRGMMARVAWGEDYHHVLHRKLKMITEFIQQKVPEAKCISMVDTGVFSDRAVAERAGIGWMGKNTSLITNEYGSWVYLGEILTNLSFPPDLPLEIEEGCGDCTKCLDFCPTGALVQGGQLDSSRCLAYLTQVKEDLPEEYRSAIGNRLYGCDTCQQVCPKNKGINFTHHPEFLVEGEWAKPLLKPLLKMGKKEFAQKFGASSAAWRGKKPIQRNALLGLAHFKDETAVPILIEVLHEDPRPSLRGAAAWSLGKIGGELAKQELQNGLGSELDASVIYEIKKSLKLL